MQSSKINELRQSTFREGRKRQKRDIIAPRAPSSGQQYLDPKKLLQYEMKLPQCPFHHQPIRYLCLKQDCKSSSFGACAHQECKNLHSDPNSDFIELNVFNDIIRESVSSLQILASKMKDYFKEIKEKIIHQIDRNTEKVIFLIENFYTPEVPRLIRQKKHSQINSFNLGNFVRRQLSEGVTIRLRMQALRNQVSDRIKERQVGLEKLIKTSQYQHLLLGDIINIEEEASFKDVSSKIQAKDFKSSIMEDPSQIQLLLKFLRENRAIGFSKMNLLFKGSENQFNSDFFHQKVDGIAPTLLFVKTTKGMKFGGYFNWKFNNRQEWISDVSGLSFLFSIDRKQSYRLKSEAQSRFKAAFGGQAGIQIGSGCDLYIYEDCNVIKKSGSNLGGSYRLPGLLEFNTLQARSYLAGQQFFLVEQIQVFQCQ